MDYREIIFELDGEIGTIRLNRTQKLNAFTFRMLSELLDALRRFADEGVRAALLTGEGKAFSAGDDLGDMGGSDDPFKDMREYHHVLIKRVRGAGFPVVAALNGYTFGAAFDLALACDFRIAAESAELGDVRVNRAMNSMSGTSYWLPRMVGVARATEILLLGQRLPAEKAYALGLVNKVVPDDELLDAAYEFCQRLLELPTLALAANKNCINFGLENTLDDSLAYEAGQLVELFESEDWVEGIASFHEKRPPRYQGK
jgi:enoyl-CoA hydratase/carnithine racemase